MATKHQPHGTKRQMLMRAVRSRPAVAVVGQRLRERDPKERTCAYEDCGVKFKPHREWQRFHSTKCRYKAWDEENPRVRIRKAR